MIKKLKMNKKEFIYSTIFNVVETLIIILLGVVMRVKIEEIIILFCLFVISRTTCYKPMHYKSPILCMIWSLAIFASFFLLTKVNIFLAMTMTVFAGYIVTEKANLKDMYMYYKSKEDKGKYKEMIEYVAKNADSEEIKIFEKKLRKINEKYKDRYDKDFFKIYKFKFKEDKSFEYIKKECNICDNHELIKILDIIFFSFNIYMDDLNKLKDNSKQLLKK